MVTNSVIFCNKILKPKLLCPLSPPYCLPKQKVPKIFLVFFQSSPFDFQVYFFFFFFKNKIVTVAQWYPVSFKCSWKGHGLQKGPQPDQQKTCFTRWKWALSLIASFICINMITSLPNHWKNEEQEKEKDYWFAEVCAWKWKLQNRKFSLPFSTCKHLPQ